MIRRQSSMCSLDVTNLNSGTGCG